MSMSISLKKDTTKTNIKHNNRNFNDKEKEQNSHIDFSRSDSNQYLVQKSLKELYKQEFGQAQADYNEKQNRNDRKIKNYYEQVKASKKTSLQQEMILQVGDSNQFQNNPENQRMANDVLKKWFDTFQERNPNLKIYNAVIHNDEASPHMHLNFVPVATGYKRGMEKQVSFDKAILGQDKTLNKERPFDDWRNREVLLLEKMLKERGIERELVGTNEFKDVNDFKEKKEQIRELDTKIVDLEKKYTAEREKLQEGVQELVKAVESSKSVEGLEVEKAGLFDRRNVKMPAEDFENMKTLAKASEALKTQNTKLQRESDANLREKQKLEKENAELKQENSKVKADLKTLEKAFEMQKRVVQSLKHTLHMVKENSLQVIAVPKQKMADLMGKARAISLLHNFEEIKVDIDSLREVVPEEEKSAADKVFDRHEKKEKEKEEEKQQIIQERRERQKDMGMER
ncbi:plasmid recombination protein [Planococcus sp. S3-L1]|uniref:plasmid recombination protein n=1 Tax=Planococcus sp. S3-L1 TaxID=3046200 RepID=UPI0024BAE362|nr:plasmid recombination protein [Planococcus sp. S3-L1]MDJ0333566.1 plasmid recombination protein [Planococcus sp. S3-L1]